MKAIRLALAVLMGGSGLVLGVAEPAFACSCASASTGEYVRYADVIVTGTLIDMQDPPQQPIMSSTDPITYTVAVDRTFKGEPNSEIEFTSAMSGASCGLEGMRVDRNYTFFLNTSGGGLTANLCGGTTSARDGLERQITQSTGPPAMSAGFTPPTATPVADGADEDSSVQSTVPFWILATAGGGIAVLAAAGTWLWRRRFREARSTA
jgi:hypothetical protein